MMWAAWFRRRRWERGMDSEMRFHLEQQVADYVRGGLSEAEARRRALQEFGVLELAKDECRDTRPLLWLDHLWRDGRLAIRSLSRTPSFALVATAVLAIGIGSSTAIFTIVNGVLLKALPYPDADRLFAVHQTVPKFNRLGTNLPVSARHFSEWRKKARSFEGIAIALPANLTLTGDGPAEQVPAATVSAEYFPVLGISPRLGRLFRIDEEPPGKDRVVILSHDFWVRRFQADRGIIGRTLRLNGERCEVIGVFGPEVRPSLLKDLHPMTQDDPAPQIFKPLGMRPEDVGAIGDFNYAGIARLRPGTAVGQAAAELSALATGVAREEVPDVEVGTRLVPLQEQIGAGTKRSLVLLLAAVGAVLLIVCLSVGNLLLARSLARAHELSIRSALGASRVLVAAPILAESIVLALAGGAAGILVARAGTAALLARAPAELPRMEDIGIDATVLAFALGVTLITALLTGGLPAWRFSRLDPQAGLQAEGRGNTRARHAGRLRQVLVTAQIALSMVSLAASGLLLHSLLRLNGVEKGFRTERVLTVDVPLLRPEYARDSERTRVFRRILDDVRAIPGVQAVAISNKLPMKGEGSNNIITLDGTQLPLLERPVADFRFVNPDYFETFSIPVHEGRAFADSDGDRRLAVISAQLAARLWPGQPAVGKRFRLGNESSPESEVVGVAGDVRSTSLDKAPPFTTYFPYHLRNRSTMTVAVRTAQDPAGVAASVRSAIWKSDPEIAPGEMKTMAELVSANVAARRFQTTLVGIFAAIGVLLACIGVYGVAAYAMTARRNEIGIRIALGATRVSVVATALRQSAMPIAAGLSAGAIASLALGRLLRGLLFGIGPHDPVALTGTAVVLGGVTLAACLIPILQASRLDPATALRNE